MDQSRPPAAVRREPAPDGGGRDAIHPHVAGVERAGDEEHPAVDGHHGDERERGGGDRGARPEPPARGVPESDAAEARHQAGPGRQVAHAVRVRRRLSRHREHPREQPHRRPGEQEAAPPAAALRHHHEPGEQEQPGDGVEHREAGECVARVGPAADVEHPQMRDGALGEGAPGLARTLDRQRRELAGAQHELLGAFAQEADMEGRGDEDESGDQQCEAAPRRRSPIPGGFFPGRAGLAGWRCGEALPRLPEQRVRGDHPRGHVGVQREPEHAPRARARPRASQPRAAREQRQGGELQRGHQHLVPAGAAGARRPVADPQQQRGEQRGAALRHLAAQPVEQRDAGEAGQRRDHPHADEVVAEGAHHHRGEGEVEVRGLHPPLHQERPRAQPVGLGAEAPRQRVARREHLVDEEPRGHGGEAQEPEQQRDGRHRGRREREAPAAAHAHPSGGAGSGTSTVSRSCAASVAGKTARASASRSSTVSAPPSW